MNNETNTIKKSIIWHIVLLERAGWYHREIGKLYGVTKQSIGRILDKNRDRFPPAGKNEDVLLHILTEIRRESLYASGPLPPARPRVTRSTSFH